MFTASSTPLCPIRLYNVLGTDSVRVDSVTPSVPPDLWSFLYLNYYNSTLGRVQLNTNVAIPTGKNHHQISF